MIEWLSPPPFTVPIDKQTRKRYSEIVPVNPVLFILFRILRVLFGETGRVSEWTRGWNGIMWRMTVLSTGYTARSNSRSALVDLEHELFFKPKCDL